jgi:hypothetical protein
VVPIGTEIIEDFCTHGKAVARPKIELMCIDVESFFIKYNKIGERLGKQKRSWGQRVQARVQRK